MSWSIGAYQSGGWDIGVDQTITPETGATGISIFVNGTWVIVDNVQLHIDGTWHTVNKKYVYQGGEWRAVGT